MLVPWPVQGPFDCSQAPYAGYRHKKSTKGMLNSLYTPSSPSHSFMMIFLMYLLLQRGPSIPYETTISPL
ncbi:hypothetical protein BJ508DRAFT_416853, partial [Ascobolus immersus RN42]